MHDDDYPWTSFSCRALTALPSISPLIRTVSKQTTSQKLKPVREFFAIFFDDHAQSRD
jgi:hypothetical protein